MSARRVRRGPLRWASAILCAPFVLLLLGPRALYAQDDPTPFWLAPPPGKDSSDAAPAKKKRPAAPPKTKTHKPIKAPPREASDDDEEPAPAPKPGKKRSPAKTRKPARASLPQDADQDTGEAEAPAAPAPKKHRYEPLPPLPHLEPPAPPTTQRPYYQAPITPEPIPAPEPVSPSEAAPQAAPPSYPATIPAYPPSYPPPPPETEPQVPVQPRSPPPLPPPPQRYWNPRAQPAAPVFTPQTTVPIDEERAGQSQQSDASDSPTLRRFSAELLLGVWAKANSDGQGHSWQLAYGVDLGAAIFRWLQLDVRALRSGGTDGDAYVNATTTHLLFDGRASGVISFGKFAAFFGGGGGLVLEQTQLFLQDVGGDPTTLSSSGLQPIGEGFIGVRARPWRGLTLRLEADALLRQGNFEPVFLLGAGWAF